jgi:predicted phage terminase large subunit-like protein
MKMTNRLLSDALKIQREQTKGSILAFAETYFSHYLKYETSEHQKHIYKVLLSISKERGKKFALAAPRGCGKSTLVTQIYVLYSICHGTEKYITIISNTASQAMQILDNIKRELRENELLRRAFPEVCHLGGITRLVHWQKDSIITGNKVMVRAFGSGQHMRGRRMGADRPSLIIADDFEDADSTFSPESREKMKNIFENSILLSGSDATNYIIIGNLFHPHCLLGDYLRDDKNNPWIRERYAAIERMPDRLDLWEEWSSIYNHKKDFDGAQGLEAAQKYYDLHKHEMDAGAILFWPERYTLYDLMIMKEENEISFLNELQNQPVDSRLLTFNTDDFRYWNVPPKSIGDLTGPSFEYYAACDPSLGKSTVKGDYSAIIVLAYDRVRDIIYVIEADIKRRCPEELMEDILTYCSRYKFVKFGVEANGFQAFVVEQLQKKADELNRHVVFDQIVNNQDKIVRIQLLRFPIKGGRLQFCSTHKELLEEARYFPKIRHDDGLDALEMAVKLINNVSQCNLKQQVDIMKRISSPSLGMRSEDLFMYDGKRVIDLFGFKFGRPKSS